MTLSVATSIPHGVEVTVTLRSGRSFTGHESSTPEQRSSNLLQLKKHVGIPHDKGSSDKVIFIAAHDEVACFERLVRRSAKC